MKKTLKLLALVISCLLICVAFVGCDNIEAMRKNQAIVTEEGVICNGKEYIPFNQESEYLTPIIDREKMIFVTEKDVRVLLSGMLGTAYYMSEDGTFLYSDEYSSIDVTLPAMYCLEEKYDEIVKKIEKGFEPVGYSYSTYDWWNDKMVDYYFTEAENKAVEKVFDTEWQIVSGPVSFDDDVFIDIISYSDDKLFSMDAFDLYKKGDGYYFVTSDEDYNHEFYYTVPEELKAVFQNIMDDYLELQAIDEYEYE